MDKLKSGVSGAIESLKSGALVNKPSPKSLSSEAIFASPPHHRIDLRPLCCGEKHIPQRFLTAQALESPQAPHGRTFHADIVDGVKVDDTRQESAIPIGLRGPISDLLQDLHIASLRIIEARSVD